MGLVGYLGQMGEDGRSLSLKDINEADSFFFLIDNSVSYMVIIN